MIESSNDTLPIRSMQDVVDETQATIAAYMDGDIPVLKTRWDKINKMLLGGFQFGFVYIVAGASGHGKSMFLNNLLRDFTSPLYNKLKKPVKILHFTFEMSAQMELLRRLSSLAEVSLNKLLYADKPVNEADRTRLQDKLNQIEEPSIYFVETPGTRIDIARTVASFVKSTPDCYHVVCLDHTLLVSSMPGENELQTLAELGRLAIALRKRFNVCLILLSQLNDKIEGDKRRDPEMPSLHYPMKTDIHGSKQLYHASDVVMVLHQPALMGLEYYGRRNLPTQDLVALHCLKNRNGQAGITLLKNNLKHGTFTDYDEPTSGSRATPYSF